MLLRGTTMLQIFEASFLFDKSAEQIEQFPSACIRSGSMNIVLYATNVAQLLLGIIICVTNALVLSAILCRQRLKTAANVLLGNICFANLIVGMVLCVVNVMDGWDDVALLKTETSLVIINSYISVASFLSLITSRYVAIRNPRCQISLSSCAKVVAIMWITVLVLQLIKAMVFAFAQLKYSGSCFRCFQVFEVVMLVIFTLSTITTYALCAYRVITHRSRTVHDESRPVQVDYAMEYRSVLSIGLLLLFFVVCFVLFVVMYIAWLGSGKVAENVDEILITVFFLHCIINPAICCCRDAELGSTVKRIVTCKSVIAAGNNRTAAAPVDPIQVGRQPGSPRTLGGVVTNGRSSQQMPRGSAPSAPAVVPAASTNSGPINQFESASAPNIYPQHLLSGKETPAGMTPVDGGRPRTPLPPINSNQNLANGQLLMANNLGGIQEESHSARTSLNESHNFTADAGRHKSTNPFDEDDVAPQAVQSEIVSSV